MENADGVPGEKPSGEDDLMYTYNRELFYSFDKEKGYTQQVSYQAPDNQVIIKQGWDAAEQRMEEVTGQVVAGRLSPVAYYMEKQLMDVSILSAYMEISKWRVRRHLKQRVFKKLKLQTLARYARIFEITVEQLSRPDFLKNKPTSNNINS
ncbi:MAG: helix-turn-helix domain-containing protein [Bacteroidota bacterium]